MQICPVGEGPKAAAFTASSRSASSRTSRGACHTAQPAGWVFRAGQRDEPAGPVEPVKFTRRTAGCATMASTTAGILRHGHVVQDARRQPRLLESFDDELVRARAVLAA